MICVIIGMINEVIMKNPYNVLGVSQSANYNTIRKKYLELAKKHHPDKSLSRNKVSEEKMKKINNAFNMIKESVHHKIIHFYHKGKFTQAEISEAVKRFNKGHSLNKMAREMNRSREAIRRHLIKLGYIADPVKRETVVIQQNWYDIFIPSFHTSLLVFMTISMIINFSFMVFICLAFIIFISD